MSAPASCYGREDFFKKSSTVVLDPPYTQPMQHGSFHNLLAGNRPDYVPTVGEGATELLWTDRHAFTVIAVSESGKNCTVQRDIATRTDKNGMSECQTYEYKADPQGAVVTVRKTKRGWYAGTRKFAFGSRREYHDFSF